MRPPVAEASRIGAGGESVQGSDTDHEVIPTAADIEAAVMCVLDVPASQEACTEELQPPLISCAPPESMLQRDEPPASLRCAVRQ